MDITYHAITHVYANNDQRTFILMLIARHFSKMNPNRDIILSFIARQSRL